MITIQNIKDIQHVFDFSVDVGKTKDANWIRVFITDRRGYSIGRLSFHNGNLYSIKNYKRSYIEDIDETDYVFMRLERYLHDGYIIPRGVMSDLECRANGIADIVMKGKLEKRAALPKFKPNGKRYKRKKLEYPNVRRILQRLVMEEGGETDEED